MSSRSLCHAAALNFITPPHDTDDDSNTISTGRVARAPPGLRSVLVAPPPLKTAIQQLAQFCFSSFFFLFCFFLISSSLMSISPPEAASRIVR